MLEPPELPLYDHEDLHGCFSALIEFIDAQLGEAVPDRFHEIPLPWDAAKKVYATDALNTDHVAPRNLFFLGIKAALDSQELVNRVVKEGKAGSRSSVQVMVITNTAGVPIAHLPAAPTEIAARAGYHYFKLESHNAKWAKVREDMSFALSLPKVESADVRLYVVAGGG
jgi:type VI secretion system protein ImpJ